jgi:hypothetical protein
VDTVRTVAQLSCSPETAARRVRDGVWQRAAYGVYVTHNRPLSDSELLAAASAHVGSSLVVTGVVALRALRARWLPDIGGIHVLVRPDVAVRSNRLVRVQHTPVAEHLETWVRHGAAFAPA